jgi:hypothetical protein
MVKSRECPDWDERESFNPGPPLNTDVGRWGIHHGRRRHHAHQLQRQYDLSLVETPRSQASSPCSSATPMSDACSRASVHSIVGGPRPSDVSKDWVIDHVDNKLNNTRENLRLGES